jgi:hypothetical protein
MWTFKIKPTLSEILKNVFPCFFRSLLRDQLKLKAMLKGHCHEKSERKPEHRLGLRAANTFYIFLIVSLKAMTCYSFASSKKIHGHTLPGPENICFCGGPRRQLTRIFSLIFRLRLAHIRNYRSVSGRLPTKLHEKSLCWLATQSLQ